MRADRAGLAPFILTDLLEQYVRLPFNDQI